MTAAVRLAGFGAALVAIFVAALVGGRAIDPLRTETSAGDARDGTSEMPQHGEDKPAPEPVRGLAVSEDGLTLSLDRATVLSGRHTELAFRIVGDDGRTVRHFDLEHTKRMHVIVVRRDMTGFQHLHPTPRPDGTWTVASTLPDPGSYRLFADFSVDDTPHTLAGDISVNGTARSQPLPAPSATFTVDGLGVNLAEGPAEAGVESELEFDVTRDGRPVAVEDYLGAKGHLVALRQGDLAFLHVHPDEHSLKFMATFPTAGTYRLFLQFQAEGRVHTAAFTEEVPR